MKAGRVAAGPDELAVSEPPGSSRPGPSPVPAEIYPAMLGSADRHLAALLTLANAAASEERLVDALRFADRARRLSPKKAVLACLCARLLTRLGQPGEAWLALAEASAVDEDPMLELERARVALELGDLAAAAGAAEALLGAFAADALPEAAAIARALREADPRGFTGWVGLRSDGAVAGEADGARIDRRVEKEALRAFAASLPPGVIGARSLGAAPSWRLEGRAGRRGNRLIGEVTLGWAPHAPSTVVVTDGEGRERFAMTTARVTRAGLTRQMFAMSLEGLAHEGALVVEALTPDKARVGLRGSPIMPPNAPRPRQPRSRPLKRPTRVAAPPALPVCVVVPVYAGREETLACLHSVLATIHPDTAELIVVDDASPEPELTSALRALAADGRITLIENVVNQGFPHSANRGMALRPDRDVVLLNADAEVFGNWLERLQGAAYARGDIGTVTPVSNNGSMMAYPGGDDDAVDAAEGAALDKVFARVNAGLTFDLPSGAGFCLYIRRDCLAEVGPLDEATFGRGYGEENDFCLRARALGWRHVGAADVFVRHAGGRSFGALKARLSRHNLRLLYRRHPGYRRAITRFLTGDPLRSVRRRIDAELLAAEPVRSALLVTLALGGGVGRHVADRKTALSAEGFRVIELAPDAETPGACRLTVAGQPLRDLIWPWPGDADAVLAVLETLHIARVEIHHLMGLGPEALALTARLGAPYDLYVHDYSWICPRITLIGGDKRYCAEPDLPACEACVGAHGSLTGEEISVAALRARSAEVMARAARVVVPSQDVAARLRRYFPRLHPEVVGWESAVTAAAARPVRTGARVRVALIGAIGDHKGYAHLLACAKDARDRDLPLEFVLIGYSENDHALFETGRVFVTGRYREEEVAALIARERCDVALVPSIWPETWCYALTHVLRSGLPILAFAMGAVAERLRSVARARLVPADTDAGTLNAALIDAARIGDAYAEPPAPRVEARTRAGSPESWIEGLRLDFDGQYRALFAGDDAAPWTQSPLWCETADPPKPLMGFAARLTGPFSTTHHCQYTGRFSSGLTAVAADGAVCRSPLANDPLVGLTVELAPA